MDNLTHTLIGVLASETLARSVAPDPHGMPATTRRNLWVTMAAVGSNLPDSDLLYSYLGDSKINYLLHHRGHTHTIVGALVLGAIVHAIAMWWLRRRKSNPSSRDRAWLVAILAFTPMPANPFCWEALLVQAESNEAVLRRAMLSLVPGLIGAEGCLSRNLRLPSTAPLESVKAIDTRALRWYGEIRTPRSELSGLAAANCEVAAAMRFIRAPWLARIEGQLILGDLRYDRERALGFAEIELREAAGRCPSFVPPWLPPRGDLLQ